MAVYKEVAEYCTQIDKETGEVRVIKKVTFYRIDGSSTVYEEVVSQRPRSGWVDSD